MNIFLIYPNTIVIYLISLQNYISAKSYLKHICVPTGKKEANAVDKRCYIYTNDNRYHSSIVSGKFVVKFFLAIFISDLQ